MSKEKQIEEMALELCRPRNIVKMIHHRTCGNCDTSSCDIYELCVDLYNAGYRKQSEGEWKSGKTISGQWGYSCSLCSASFVGENAEWIAKEHDYCPKCGAKMKGGGENADIG